MRRVHSKHGQCSSQGTGACGQWVTLPLFSPWNMTFRFVEEIDNPSFFGVQKIAKECWCQFLGCVVIKDLGRREVQMWYDVVLKGAGAKQTRIEGVKQDLINKNVVFEPPPGFHHSKWCTAGDWSDETASDTVFFEGIMKCWSMRSIYYPNMVLWCSLKDQQKSPLRCPFWFLFETILTQAGLAVQHQWLPWLSLKSPPFTSDCLHFLAGFYWIQCTLNGPKSRHWMTIVSLCFLFTRAIWYTVYMGMWCTPC